MSLPTDVGAFECTDAVGETISGAGAMPQRPVIQPPTRLPRVFPRVGLSDVLGGLVDGGPWLAESKRL